MAYGASGESYCRAHTFEFGRVCEGVQVEAEFGPYRGVTSWAGGENIVAGEGYSSAYFVVKALYPEHFDKFPGGGFFLFVWDVTFSEDFSYVPARDFFRPGLIDRVFDSFSVSS